jgi:trans-aconitate methyltransferase
VSSHFELTPEQYERSRLGHMQERRREIVAAVLAAYARPGGTIVELGCGPGALVASLAGSWPETRFVGLDVEPEMIGYAAAAHRAANLRFEVADLARERPDLIAEAAFSVDLVHHVHALEPFLANVRRLLVAGGRWVLMEPNVLHPYVLFTQERMRRKGLDEDHFRPRGFERALPAASLVVEARRTALLFPASVRRVPGALARVERTLERIPVLGGARVYVLRAV